VEALMIDTQPLQLLTADQIVNSIWNNTDDLLMDVMYIAVLNLHYYSEMDQEKIVRTLNENIYRISNSNDRLWIAKIFKNSYLSLSSNVVELYFNLLYTIEETLIDGNYDIKLLAELLEQFGRLFKTYPEKEKRKIVKVFGKYLATGIQELVLASYESIMMAIHDFGAENKLELLSIVHKISNKIDRHIYENLVANLGAGYENCVCNS
jgi:hypothetical protein